MQKTLYNKVLNCKKVAEIVNEIAKMVDEIAKNEIQISNVLSDTNNMLNEVLLYTKERA